MDSECIWIKLRGIKGCRSYGKNPNEHIWKIVVFQKSHENLSQGKLMYLQQHNIMLYFISIPSIQLWSIWNDCFFHSCCENNIVHTKLTRCWLWIKQCLLLLNNLSWFLKQLLPSTTNNAEMRMSCDQNLMLSAIGREHLA